jgi:mRNA-degrading endonuclease toxin of MazEF toxin-antitoxin module
MSRHSEIVTVGEPSIETYVDGAGPAVVITRPTAETVVMTSSRSPPP